MTPAVLAPRTAIPVPRLNLHPAPGRRAVVDGSWWPRSRDAAAELPALVTAVDGRLERTALLVGVSRRAWQRVPRRIPAGGRQVRVGWFRHGDPDVVVLFFACREPVALLVIPPDTAAGAAEEALALTGDDVLMLTRPPSEPTAQGSRWPTVHASAAPVRRPLP